MGTVLGINKDVFQQAEKKFKTGFRLPPAGPNILWVIKDFKLGNFTKKDTGAEQEYLSFVCQMTDDEGQDCQHWEFFQLETEKDIGHLGAFLDSIGRSDWVPGDHEIEDLVGTKFKCDFSHYDWKNKNTGEVEKRGRLEFKTIVPVNWEDGEPVDGDGTDGYEEEEEERAPKPRRRGRPRKEAPPEEPEDDEGEDDGEDDDEPEEKGFKSFSPRRKNGRRRRAASSDKD